MKTEVIEFLSTPSQPLDLMALKDMAKSSKAYKPIDLTIGVCTKKVYIIGIDILPQLTDELVEVYLIRITYCDANPQPKLSSPEAIEEYFAKRFGILG